MTEDETWAKDRVKALINERGGLYDILNEILVADDKVDDSEYEPKGKISPYGWELNDIRGLNPYIVGILKQNGLIDCDYKRGVGYRTNKYTNYRVVPEKRDVIAEALTDIDKIIEEAETVGESGGIPEDLFDVIEGYDNVIQIFLMSLQASKPVHILLIGPPASGKSVFLMELERLKGAKAMTAGLSTKAGIRDLIVEEQPPILIIDEVDKVSNQKDLDAIYMWMDQNRVIVTKYQMRLDETATKRSNVYGACNRKDKVAVPLLSRFIKFTFKPYTLEEFIKVTVNVLIKREDVPEELAKYIAGSLGRTGERDVRQAIEIARLLDLAQPIEKAREIVDFVLNTMAEHKDE